MFDVPQSMIEENIFGMENEGICLACGEFQGGCEPDARNYTCDSCGKNKVFGLEEAMIMGAINIID